MKQFNYLAALCFAVGVALTGCNKDKQTINTAPLANSFKTAEPASQTNADKAVSAIKSVDYSTALADLKGLASNAKLTPEQQQAIKDVLAQVQNAITDTANKVKGEATKAADDLKKSLSK